MDMGFFIGHDPKRQRHMVDGFLKTSGRMGYDPRTPVPGNAPRSGVQAADEELVLAELPKSYPNPL